MSGMATGDESAARMVVVRGTDPDVRAVGEDIVVVQKAAIAWMTEWRAQAEE